MSVVRRLIRSRLDEANATKKRKEVGWVAVISPHDEAFGGFATRTFIKKKMMIV